MDPVRRAGTGFGVEAAMWLQVTHSTKRSIVLSTSGLGGRNKHSVGARAAGTIYHLDDGRWQQRSSNAAASQS
ncbi:hypothetical protein O1611_g4697 [Lasiodiplodia mahajangana]|uniref:Uncharacterized protein n=1 Tax=Lasiodiplodia mahajangana TaxID=1108764 RepID=A0ACC2JND2_9PEZI|nr:hypothetical protein O1611_g4697 [Lasiodiplodia mahajangana]